MLCFSYTNENSAQLLSHNKVLFSQELFFLFLLAVFCCLIKQECCGKKNTYMSTDTYKTKNSESPTKKRTQHQHALLRAGRDL